MAFIHNSALLEGKKVTGSAVFRRLFSSVHKRVSVFIAAPVRPLRCKKLGHLTAPGTKRNTLYLGAYLTNVLEGVMLCFVTPEVNWNTIYYGNMQSKSSIHDCEAINKCLPLWCYRSVVRR